MKGAGEIGVRSASSAISYAISKKHELDGHKEIGSSTTPGAERSQSTAAAKLIDRVCEAKRGDSTAPRGSYSTGKPVAP